ncbi:virulence RhuM family protein [Algoriphagus sp. AGSA1]|uniref:virulence RhuM family protein n=1 Tax=Algoriphagus sp. AGSA1 TaxID=2907213 RepID=UPI001F1A776A|nr:RhuM family protein [Algoriphagus sp. AGSA1]MCE7057540.1 virulence RhuM family protein [Algoriphagus sp. AGSA1]
MENQIEIYQGSDGQTQIEVKFEQETVWLSQEQIAELFGKGRSTITEHIRNVFKEGELEEPVVRREFRHTTPHGAIVGKTQEKVIKHYNLDVIISVVYRVKSNQGTQFRIWATKRLKDYLIQGYTINESRLAQKEQEVQTLKDGIRILSRAIQQKEEDQNLDWLNHFAKGLELLDDYDHENLDKKGLSKRKANYPDLAQYQEVIKSMRSDFEPGVFGKEKDGSFESAIAQISKGFGE